MLCLLLFTTAFGGEVKDLTVEERVSLEAKAAVQKASVRTHRKMSRRCFWIRPFGHIWNHVAGESSWLGKCEVCGTEGYPFGSVGDPGYVRFDLTSADPLKLSRSRVALDIKSRKFLHKK
jgi:hypothetical protein